MTSIPAVAAQFLAQPAPVLIIDTCNFLDLLRRDAARQQPRVPAEEIRVASILLEKVTTQPDAVHLAVPELVPGEFADHADRIEAEFEKWLKAHDENQVWLAEAARWVGTVLPSPLEVARHGLQVGFRSLANDLLARAVVLQRDQTSLDRAITRLIGKRRPSHNREIKDSMNLEQSLELCSQLRNAGFMHRVAFVSSNTNDYAAPTAPSRLHADLQPEFAAVSLEYFPSLRAAVGAMGLP